jgi:hypothetical protein
MSRASRSLTTLLLACGLLLSAAPLAATSIHFDFDGQRVGLDGDVAVITAEDGSKARISPEGELTVRGKKVRTAERERRFLRRYNESLHRIEDTAIELGVRGAGLAVTALAEVAVALASGDGERAERRLEGKAEGLKDRARELCHDFDLLLRLQDELADELPAFRPYAVIGADGDVDCRIED